MNNQLAEKIFRFLQERKIKHCAIATVDKNGKPECAVMGYVVKKDLTLIYTTDSGSRKWTNMQNNHFVAIAVGWDIDKPFLQYEGIVKCIGKNNSEYGVCEKLYFADHPHSLQFKGLITSVFYQVKPVWIRVSDSSVFPPKIEEINL